MNDSSFQDFIGTRWEISKASLLQKANKKVITRVTAPPREVHEITESSRILRILDEEGSSIILLSHR